VTTWLPLGKLPATPARPKLCASTLLAGLPAPSASVDMYSGVTGWPMYLNDRYGICVWAGFGHHIEQITRYGQGRTVEVADSDVETGYESTGFNPDDPNSDQGTNVEDGLSYWRKTGLAGHKIVAYAAVDVSNATEVKQAVEYFGAVGVGFNFPAYAMDQFDAGKPWDVQKANAGIEGGHYVIVVGYDGTYFYVVTWGKIQKMTPAFFRKYVDEAYVVADDEMVSKASQYVSGTDLHAFGEQFADLTGEANPFPADAPPVTPPDTSVTAAQVASAVRAALTGLDV
jgi:hypothetical protein